jgi:hypothetical protein
MYAVAMQWVPASVQFRDKASLREEKWSVNSKNQFDGEADFGVDTPFSSGCN